METTQKSKVELPHELHPTPGHIAGQNCNPGFLFSTYNSQAHGNQLNAHQ